MDDQAVRSARKQSGPRGAVRFECVGSGARYGSEQFQLPRISAGEASLDATDEAFNGMRRVATESLRQPPQQRQV